MNSNEEIDVKFNEITNFVDITLSNFSEHEKNSYNKNLSLVSKQISSIEKENYEIRRLNKIIENTKKEFIRENGFIVIGLFLGLIVSTLYGTSFQYSVVLIIGGIYLLYKNNDKNNEILIQTNKINSCNGTISIFKRDLNILGVDNFCIENLIKYRNQNNDFYTDELYPKEREISQSIKDRVGCSIVISDYQIKLFTIKYTLDDLGITYNKDTFENFLNSYFLM
jgi:hypothetical protein